MSLSLRQILYQSDLKAKPVRDNFTDIENNANDLQDQIDAFVAPSTKVQINTCESLTGWTANDDAALSLNSTTYREGTKSIQFDKTGATTTTFQATLSGLSLVLDNRKITVWIYIADNTTRDNLNAATSPIDIGTGTDYKRIDLGLTGIPFATGWNEFILDYDNPDAVIGSVPSGFVNTLINLEFNSTASGDTFVNKILIDDIYYGPNDASETINARDYHNVLRDRIRSLTKGIGNTLITGGVVSEQGTPDMTFAVTAGEAIVDGVGCKWDAQNSGTITAPGSNTRLDYVVVNSDNTISVVAGTAAASPVFPSVASSQLVIGALVVKAATTSLNDGVEVFNFLNGSNPYFPNVYINGAYTATNKYHNNVIVDTTSTITGTLECQGYCHVVNYTVSGSDGSSSGGSSNCNYEYNSGTDWKMGNGYQNLIGSGGYTPLGGITNTTFTTATSGTSGGSLVIKAYSAFIRTFTANGGNGGSCASNTTRDTGRFAYGGFGGGGGSGGSITITCIDEIVVLSGGAFTANGGNGGDATPTTSSVGTLGNLAGNGGGGGSGGSIITTSASYVNNGTVASNNGTGGAGGTASGGDNSANGVNGGAGGSGSVTNTLYDLTTGITSPYSWIHPLYTMHGYLK